jgi:ankyrin repeat protein
MHSVAFSNHSTNSIWVERILCDGTLFPAPCGALSPGGSKASVAMFPSSIPNVFRIEYEKSNKMLMADIPASDARAAIDAAKPANEITLHFIYSDQENFILKIYFDRGEESLRLDGELWPDEKEPLFQRYKELVRSAYSGDSERAKQLVSSGAPLVWKNEPITLTPLEWSVRWDHLETFKLLMSAIPDDYPGYNYANCLKVAARDDVTEILELLLSSPHAKAIPADSLQDLFYSVCSSAQKLSTLQSILKCYNVGVDFKVRDYGHTLLFVAVQADNHEFARWLISQGANRDAMLESRRRPIDFARSKTMEDILRK